MTFVHSYLRFFVASLMVAQCASSTVSAAPSKAGDQGPLRGLIRHGTGWGFSLDVPASMSLHHKNGPDFDVFYLQEKGKVVLGWYVGNWPDFPENAAATVVGNVPGRCVSTPDSFSCLFELHGAFEYLHIWSQGSKSKDFLRVQAILQTLTLDARKPPN